VGYFLTFGNGVGSPEAIDIENARCLTLIGSHLGENMHNTQGQEFADAFVVYFRIGYGVVWQATSHHRTRRSRTRAQRSGDRARRVQMSLVRQISPHRALEYEHEHE
jgi:hypothetical protein